MESSNNSKSWGGVRKGAGRKSMDPSEKKVPVTFYVKPSVRDHLQEVADEAGMSVGQFLVSLVDKYA